MRTTFSLLAAALVGALAFQQPHPRRRTPPKMKMTTDIPPADHHAGLRRDAGSAR